MWFPRGSVVPCVHFRDTDTWHKQAHLRIFHNGVDFSLQSTGQVKHRLMLVRHVLTSSVSARRHVTVFCMESMSLDVSRFISYEDQRAEANHQDSFQQGKQRSTDSMNLRSYIDLHSPLWNGSVFVFVLPKKGLLVPKGMESWPLFHPMSQCLRREVCRI